MKRGIAVIAVTVKDKDGISNRWSAWLATDLPTIIEYFKREEKFLSINVGTTQEIPLSNISGMKFLRDGKRAILEGIYPVFCLGVITVKEDAMETSVEYRVTGWVLKNRDTFYYKISFADDPPPLSEGEVSVFSIPSIQIAREGEEIKLGELESQVLEEARRRDIKRVEGLDR